VFPDFLVKACNILGTPFDILSVGIIGTLVSLDPSGFMPLLFLKACNSLEIPFVL
jgi:hypothetical protein